VPLKAVRLISSCSAPCGGRPHISDTMFNVLGPRPLLSQSYASTEPEVGIVTPRIGHITSCHIWHEYCSRKYPNEWLVVSTSVITM
jgi:hypothetical protein